MKNFPGTEPIRLKDALAIMANGEPCSLGFCDYNEKAKTGGNYREIDQCVKVGVIDKHANKTMISVRKVGDNTHPIAVHTWLIMKFNNLPVIL